MTREIKFRGWDTTINMMLPVEDVHFRQDGFFQQTKKKDPSAHLALPDGGTYLSGKPHVMQFTGLQDKNGVDIYEGDIVRSSHYPEEYISAIRFDPHCGYTPDHGLAFDNSWVKHEVIGNIHENPELLEESALDHKRIEA